MFSFSLIGTLLYFLPTFIAAHRGHRVGGIFILNLLFGWTGIGWLAMLLWSLLSFPALLRSSSALRPLRSLRTPLVLTSSRS